MNFHGRHKFYLLFEIRWNQNLLNFNQLCFNANNVTFQVINVICKNYIPLKKRNNKIDNVTSLMQPSKFWKPQNLTYLKCKNFNIWHTMIKSEKIPTTFTIGLRSSVSMWGITYSFSSSSLKSSICSTRTLCHCCFLLVHSAYSAQFMGLPWIFLDANPWAIPNEISLDAKRYGFWWTTIHKVFTFLMKFGSSLWT